MEATASNIFPQGKPASEASLTDSGVFEIDTDERDREAYQREVLRHRRELTTAAIRLTGSKAEADDLVQEAVMRAWVFWHRFEAGTNGRAWMHRILINTFINGYRRKRREREILSMVHDVESHEQRTHAAETKTPGESLSDEVQRALGSLPREFRDVVVLVDLQDLSYRDASTALGCPIGTVMSRLHRGRRAMQRALSGYASKLGYSAGEQALEAA